MFAGDSYIDVFFFFSSRRRHTRLQGDWSSDVCSSDLGGRSVLLLRSARKVSRMAQPLLKNCPAAESDPGAHAPARHKADSCCSFFAWLAYSNSAGLRLCGHFTFFILEPQFY